MSRRLLRCLPVLFFFSFSIGLSSQTLDMPHVIRYSGDVKNADGSPRVGTVSVTFSIYADDRSPVALWQEVQNVTTDAEGRYSVLLGAARSEGVPDELFTSNKGHWLGIRVNNEQEQPRTLLGAVPYAMKAGDAETLGGKPLSAFALIDAAGNSGGSSPSATDVNAGGVSGSTSKLHPLSINTSGSSGVQNYVPLWTDNAGTLGDSNLYQSGSNVGVGTTNPQGLFQVGTDFAFMSNWPTFGLNLYYNGGWHYATSNSGTVVQQDYINNGLNIAVAGAGTAGNPATISNAMFVSSNGGFVGMGTTSPKAPLQVGPDLTLSSAWPTIGYNLYYNGGWKYATTNSATLMQQDYTNGGLTFSAAPSGTADASVPLASAMFISGTARVGIGTTSPTQKLDVAGNVNATGNMVASGTVTANVFSGSGASLTSLPAGNLTGNIPNATLTSTSLPAGNLTGTVPSAAISGTYSNAVTLSNVSNTYYGNGANLANVNAASVAGISSAALNLRLITYLGGCDSCSVLTGSDNQKLIYQNLLGAPLSLVSITCYSDTGTPSIDIQRDSSGTLGLVTASSIPCSTSPTAVTSFSIATLNANDKVNFLMTTPDLAAHRVTVIIKTTL